MDWKLHLRSTLVKMFRPFSAITGKISWPCKAKIHPKTAEIILRIVEPGDVLVLKKRGHMSNLFIPGFYKHAAIVTGNPWIVDAVAPEVRIIHGLDLLTQYDHCALLRPNFLTLEEKEISARTAKKFIGKPYDFSFEEGTKAFYCSELVTYCIRQAWSWKRKLPCPWQHRDVFGMLTVVPQDFYDSSKFTKIFVI